MNIQNYSIADFGTRGSLYNIVVECKDVLLVYQTEEEI